MRAYKTETRAVDAHLSTEVVLVLAQPALQLHALVTSLVAVELDGRLGVSKDTRTSRKHMPGKMVTTRDEGAKWTHTPRTRW